MHSGRESSCYADRSYYRCCFQDEEGEWEEVTETSPQPGTVFGFEQSNHDSAHPQGKKKRTHSKAGGSQPGHHQQTQNGAGGHNKHSNGHAHGHGNNGLHGHRAYGQVSQASALEQP
jgi:hypothetical protein